MIKTRTKTWKKTCIKTRMRNSISTRRMMYMRIRIKMRMRKSVYYNNYIIKREDLSYNNAKSIDDF